VKQLRTAVKLTQKEVAHVAGITDVQLSRIENGESGTSRDTIPGLAAALGADLSETYQRAGFFPPISSDEDEAFAEEIALLVKRVPRQSRDMYKRIVKANAESVATAMLEAA
jgi:transcriptional regulator with XRE-family HTH domain